MMRSEVSSHLRRFASAVYGAAALLLLLGSGPAAALTGVLDLCGNRVVDAGEDCDDGGLCVGGADAGTPCGSDSACSAMGVCTGPQAVASACTTDLDCGESGRCRHCLPFGGDGCAANCTDETEVAVDLIAGQIGPSGEVAPGTSAIGLRLPDEISFFNVSLPLSGAMRLRVGRDRAGEVPLVIREHDLPLSAADVSGISCVCTRGMIPKTCGGAVLEDDGETRVTDCSLDEDLCNRRGEPPCVAVNGPGNILAGALGCDGRSPISFADLFEKDSVHLSTVPGGSGDKGSIASFLGLRLDSVIGSCFAARPEYGSDQRFCTEDDPISSLSSPITLADFATTARSCAILSGTDLLLGPICLDGNSSACTSEPSAAELTCLTMAVPRPNVPQLGDTVGIGQMCFDFSVVLEPTPQPTATPTASPSPTFTVPPTPTVGLCVGDCRGDGSVTVDEILRGVAIALGNLPLDSCSAIDSDGNLEATVDEIVRSVNLALNGC